MGDGELVVRRLRGVMLAFALAASSLPPAAQETEQRPGPRLRAAQTARDSYREQVNENVLFLMGGQPGTSHVVIAHDMAQVVNDGLRLRVLPVVGNAAAQNVSDVIFLRGIDLALTSLQVLEVLKESKQFGANLDRQIVYISALASEEMHVLARRGINAIEDLQGKKVALDSAGSATALLSPRILKELKISVDAYYLPQADAIEKMRSGEIDATICICAKPLTILSEIPADSGFKLIEVPFADGVRDAYLPATLSADDYPRLLSKGAKIETVATTMVLISFNWPKGSARYARTVKFVEALFTRFPELQRAPRHASWQSVNLAASLSGWQRFPAAQDWIDRNGQALAALRTSLNRALQDEGDRKGGAEAGADSDRLFREFMDFMRKERGKDSAQ
jgi:uncharacterized protein